MLLAEGKIYDAEMRDVFSADDLVLFIDLGVGSLFVKERFRLRGVAAPNAVGQSSLSDAGKLRGLVFDMVRRKKLRITVQTFGHRFLVGTLEIGEHDGSWVNLNQYLIDKGYSFNRKENQ